MVGHFLQITEGPDEQEAERLRLMTTSHLETANCTAAL